MKKIVLLTLTIAILGISCSHEDEDMLKDCTQIKEEGFLAHSFHKPENWGKLNWAEKAAICNIPENELKNMCTCELVEAYFNHPLLPGYFSAYTYVKMGLNQMKEEYNGMRELIERTDGYREIIDKYKNMDPSAIKDIKSPLDKVSAEMDITYVEATLAQDDFLSQLDQKEITGLLEEALVKLDTKNQIEQSSSFSIQSTCYLIANILNYQNYTPFKEYVSNNTNAGISHLIGGWLLFVNEKIQIPIKGYANQFLKSNN